MPKFQPEVEQALENVRITWDVRKKAMTRLAKCSTVESVAKARIAACAADDAYRAATDVRNKAVERAAL